MDETWREVSGACHNFLYVKVVDGWIDGRMKKWNKGEKEKKKEGRMNECPKHVRIISIKRWRDKQLSKKKNKRKIHS